MKFVPEGLGVKFNGLSGSLEIRWAGEFIG